MVVAPAGLLAAVGDVDGTWRGFDARTGERRFEAPRGAELLAISASGTAVVAALAGGGLWMWPDRPAPDPGRYLALAIADDGETLAILRDGRLDRGGATVELPPSEAGRLRGDGALECLAVEGAAAFAEPRLRVALGPDLQPFWSEPDGVEEVLGPVAGGAVFSSSAGGIVRRAPGGTLTADGTPADALSVSGERLLAARPLAYEGASTRTLLRTLDAHTLSVLDSREVTLAGGAALRLTPAGEVIALRPADEGRALEVTAV